MVGNLGLGLGSVLGRVSPFDVKREYVLRVYVRVTFCCSDVMAST